MLQKAHDGIVWSLFLTVFLTGCFAHVQTLPPADPQKPSFPPLSQDSEVLIGVALSGGGSRAAYFGAAGLEALATVSPVVGRSLLEQIGYLSSVSGGSVASSYFVTHKPKGTIAILDQDGSLSPTYRSFFEQYRTTMSKNFQWAMEWRQLVNVRWLNSNQRATSLSEVFDAEYLKGMTLDQLYDREKRGDTPRLILNSTLYNNGRRFVLTTVPREDFQYNFIRKLEKELEVKSPTPKKLPRSLELAKDALNPQTFQDEGADPSRIPLSKAVAASASFPFFIGPITAQVKGEKDYVHIGDGGLFDNQGTESLVQLFLKKIDERKSKRALVIAFDSSFPFWVKNTALDRMENGFDIFVKDSGRIVSIMEQRANAYQSMVWHILQSQGIVLPDETTVKVIILRHTDEDIWPDDPHTVLPEACHDNADKLRTKRDFREWLALIPTKFKLTSNCDKALLRLAAARSVDRHKVEMVKFLRGNQQGSRSTD